VEYRDFSPSYEGGIYERQVLDRYGRPDPKEKLVMGPGIADWPRMASMKKNLLLVTAGSYQGSVTTDELIPSGEASSYRSNPEKISGFTLISRDPAYVARAKKVREEAAEINFSKEGDITLGTLLAGDRIGDGSSREQAASCQKVLGGWANIAKEYATKRYRSNLINWGMLPFVLDEDFAFDNDDYIFVPGIREAVLNKTDVIKAYVVNKDMKELSLKLGDLTDAERDLIAKGCLINYYRA
jgi:aconitate hydratase